MFLIQSGEKKPGYLGVAGMATLLLQKGALQTLHMIHPTTLHHYM